MGFLKGEGRSMTKYFFIRIPQGPGIPLASYISQFGQQTLSSALQKLDAPKRLPVTGRPSKGTRICFLRSPGAKMTLPALVVFLLTWGLTGTDGSLLELAQMIKDVTGKNAVPHYSSYGCYCGLGGKGTPLDETDRCCYDHDRCYGRVDAEGCDSKATFYHYSVHSGKVQCGGGEWWRKLIFGHQPPCEQEICECDKRLVLCLKKHAKSYRAAYRFYPNFLCFGPKRWH